MVDLTGPFDVAPLNLKQLSAEEAVWLFRELLVAEALQCAVPVSAVDVSSAITTADGGIDAEVGTAPGTVPIAGLIMFGPTRYQIKTGGFDVKGLADIKELLLAPQHRSRAARFRPEHLNPRVRSCLEKNNAFVAVLFGAELTGKTDDYGEKEIRTFLKKIDLKFAKASIRIIRANQLCSAIKILSPGMAMRLNGLGGKDGNPLHDSKYLRLSCDLEIDLYLQSEELKADAESISRFIANPTGFQHLRVLGDAGAGKTHLVYQGTKGSPHVLYCPEADQLDSSSAFERLLELSEKATIVLIADECDMQTALLLQARLKKRAVRCVLVSVFNQIEDNSPLGDRLPVITVPRLDTQLMTNIFVGYAIDKETSEWLAKLCEGSPKAAHRIGHYAKANPEIDLAQHFHRLDDIWNAVVCSPNTPTSSDGVKRLTIARTIALFRRLPWEGAEAAHSREVVHAILTQLDPSISKAMLLSIVKDFRTRRFLQGVRNLYISPVLLHIALWRDWWETYEAAVGAEQVRRQLTGRLRGWFDEMLMYASESRAASKVAERLLGPGGPFATLTGFSAPGNPALFFALAQGNSKAALRRLKIALEDSSVDQRRQFGPGRREVIRGLERMAVPRDTFFDAVECLLLLAEAENETWSNNATGVFASIFTLGYGKLAASEVTPSQKIPYLRGLLESSNKAKRSLGFKALSESLSLYLSRGDIGDYEGLHPLPQRWTPSTYAELWEEFRKYVELAYEASHFLPKDERGEAVKAIVSNSRGLISLPPVSLRLIEILREYAREPQFRGDVIEHVIQILHYDKAGLQPEVATQLALLKGELTESTFGAKVRRYAGLQLVEDHFEDTGDHVDIPQAIFALTDEALANPELLCAELEWLVTDEAKNGYTFGHVLGKQDADLTLWTPIRSAWQAAGPQRTDFFIGGYLGGLFNQDEGLWELVVGELFETLESSEELLRLAWRSGMTETVANELHLRLKVGEISPRSFGVMVYGGVIGKLPQRLVIDVIERLLTTRNATDASIALDILQSRIRNKPEEFDGLAPLTHRVLTHPGFIVENKDGGRNAMRHYHWTKVAMKLLATEPDRAWDVAAKVLRHFGKRGTVLESSFASAVEFLDKLLEADPSRSWGIIAPLVDPKIDVRGFNILSWLHGKRMHQAEDAKPSGFELIPVEVIADWIRSDSRRSLLRAQLIAEYCPPEMTRPEEPKSLARVVLEEWGNSPPVRRALHRNFFSGSYWGPASDHYEAKRQEAVTKLAAETQATVRLWLTEEVEELSRFVKMEREREALDE